MTVPASVCVAVACSGGRDSVALLHATVRAACGVPGLQVVALHVHHGLSPQADAWQALVQSLCEQWASQGWPVRCVSQRVTVTPQGRGIEAQARDARYAALAEMARQAQAELVLLGHHRRDQAETFVLQALRSGGVAGLSAMPVSVEREGIEWTRPWLTHSREAIEAYVAEHQLPFVDDDSNQDTRFSRNRLRLSVWPALEAAFPQAEMALAASATRLADVQAVLDDTMADLVEALSCSGSGEQAQAGATLDAQVWASLDGPHRRLSLQHWYRAQTGRALSANWLLRLTDEVPALLERGTHAAWSSLGLGLYRGRLACEAMPEATAEGGLLCLSAPGVWTLPAWGGTLQALACEQGGVAWPTLSQLRLLPREGGEQFMAGPGRPARSLKKQYQAAGVPAWLRQGPLLWAGDALVFVPGLGLDARVLAPAGEAQATLAWHRGV